MLQFSAADLASGGERVFCDAALLAIGWMMKDLRARILRIESVLLIPVKKLLGEKP